MRAILVASAPNDSFENLYVPQPFDLIIGVDGGCKNITKYEIDIAFGDFDSLTVPPNAKKVYRYKKEKDETDLELAVQQMIKRDEIDEIIIYNATGGRLDHFLCNLKLLVVQVQNLQFRLLNLSLGLFQLIYNHILSCHF